MDHYSHSATECSMSVPSMSFSMSGSNIENARNIMCNNVQNTNLNYLSGDSQRLLMVDKYFANSRDQDLAFITEWLHKSPAHILWLRGAAATGKSTFLRHLITIFRQKKQLGTFYFVPVGCNLDPLEVVKLMAHEISNTYSGLSIPTTSLPSDYPLEDHFAHFVLHSLQLVRTSHILLIAIDAIDQYEHGIRLLQALCRAEYPNNIKIIFTGRPNELLTWWLNSEEVADRVEVHDLCRIDDLVMKKYIETRLNERKDWRSEDGRPSQENIKNFAHKAAGYIGWAAFAANLICDPAEAEPDDILEDVMEMVPTLSTLYAKVLEPLSKRSERNRKVLGMLSVIKEPLSKEALDELTFARGLPAKDVCNRLRVLQTGVHLTPMDVNFHSSFLEFLRNHDPDHFMISVQDSNLLVFRSCTTILEKHLLSTRAMTSDAALYSSEYWSCHATDVAASLTDPFPGDLRGELDCFIKKCGKKWAHFQSKRWNFDPHIEKLDTTNGIEQFRALARMAEGSCGGEECQLQLPAQTLLKITSVQALVLQLSDVNDSKRGEDLYTLGALLLRTHVHRGAFSHLDQAIAIIRESLELLPMDEPRRNCCLNTLGSSLQARYAQRGDAGDLEEAMAFHREAVKHFVPWHPHADISVGYLGMALQSRYSLRGMEADIEEAIQCYYEMVELCPPGHPRRSLALRELSDVLSFSSRHRDIENERDFRDPIMLLREALAIYPPQGPDRLPLLLSLADALHDRCRATADLKDLDEALELFQEAVKYPMKGALWPLSLHPSYDFARALCTSYDQRRNIEQLNKAIDLYRMEDRPPGKDCTRGWYEGYSSALLKRYEAQGKEEDLEEAIVPLRESLELYMPDDPNRRHILHRLFGALQIRYDKRSHVDDWNELTALHREILELDYRAQQHHCCIHTHPECWQQHEDSTNLEEGNIRVRKPVSTRFRCIPRRSWRRGFPLRSSNFRFNGLELKLPRYRRYRGRIRARRRRPFIKV